MSAQDISRIEQAFAKLPLDEKAVVIAKLRFRLDQESQAAEDAARVMAEMAADPDIQRELQAISTDFANAEADGLENESWP